MKIRHRLFIEEYVADARGNGADAARRAGYSKASANKQAARLLKDPDIKAAIDERLKQLTMSADEATKHITDIARTRMQDYMVVKKVLKTRMVRKPLKVLIAQLEQEIELEAEFFDLADLNEKQQDIHHAEQAERKMKVLRYQLELKQNPKAYRDGPETFLEEEAGLDLVALAKAKDEGNISELSFNEFGPKVKMYSAAKELETILKINGRLVEKVDHTSNGKSFFDFLIDASTETSDSADTE